MRCVIQRVSRASVTAEEGRAEIGRGLLVLAGLETGDGEETVAWVARKIAALRIFDDDEGRMNLGLDEVNGAILAVSQFTLAGSLERGRRPGFDRAMPPEPARALFARFVDLLKAEGARVETGFFRSHMAVELVNDGPVTFVLDRV
jgi:D-tyrosyl-tRNA(Tyr) deacylase